MKREVLFGEKWINVTELPHTGPTQISEASLELFAEYVPIGFGVVRGGHYIYVNPALLGMFGFENTHEMVGRSVESLFTEDRSDMAGKGCPGQEPPTDAHGSRRLTGVTRDETRIYVEACSSEINYEGEAASLVFYTDVTEREFLRERMQYAEKMEAMGALAGGIAHDFNNILFVISGYSELVLGELPDDSRLKTHVRQVLAASARATELVGQILLLSRERKGQRSKTLISPILKETVKFLRTVTPVTIEIRQNIKSEVYPIVADPSEIRQLVLSVCAEAVRAMKREGGVLEVGLENAPLETDQGMPRREIDRRPCVMLRVKATSTIKDPDLKSEVVEPHFWAIHAAQAGDRGHSAVHEIISSYGGSISVERDEGTGWVFSTCLPAIGEEGTPRNEGIRSVPRGQERILFVDHEESAADLGGLLLESLGYQVTVARSGREALDLFQSGPDRFDAVITEMTMPKMSGTELAEQLVKLRHDVQVILCLGSTEMIDEAQTAASGIRIFLTKPFTAAQMASTIRHVLDA